MVTNNRIGPPNKVQNRRIKQTFDTYAYTIDIVPLVLEKTCFSGIIFKYKWKINKTKQKAQSRKHNVEMCKGNSTYTMNLDRALTWEGPRLTKEQTT